MHAVSLCSGTNIQRKQREMRLIFQLGTIRPKGLNINFSFIWIGTLNTSALAITGARAAIMFMSIVLRSTVQRFFLTLMKGHKPETFVFFKKKIDTFWYFLPNITSSAIQNVFDIIDRFYARDVKVV